MNVYKQMIPKYFLILLTTAVAFSCGKNAASKSDTYVVSASKMIGITENNWRISEPQLKDKTGYQYKKYSGNLSAFIEAVVSLPAIDDSNRTVKGSILLNVSPNKKIYYAAFDTEPLTKTAAYAMMLNYNDETLQTLTAISSSIGEIDENSIDQNIPVSAVLSKVNSGQEANKLAVIYNSRQGRFIMVVTRRTDGQYLFSCRCEGY